MDINEYMRRKEELEKFAQENGRKVLLDGFRAFFAANPLVGAVHWAQYTPHFNDGDPCTFGVGELMLKPIEDDEEQNEDDDEDDEDYYNGCTPSWKATGALKEAYEGLRELTRLPNEIFETAFGDHVKVTVHRDETVEVDDYEHD
jgi:hypothetical protein